VEKFTLMIDRISAGLGKAFAWCIMLLTFGVGYEVFMRYVLRAPTTWAFDISYIMYGALFMMAGAYTLSRNAHVRGDVVYRLMSPRGQGLMDLLLYLIFFFPAFGAMLIYGLPYAQMSWRFNEVSIYSPAGVPIYPSKIIIPVAAGFMLLQGVAEVIRCCLAIKNNHWPQRLHDVEEMETLILREAQDQARAVVAKGGTAL
jgi:TRAP-type mannitol/chloroaromatic compound transport system permease small subunit